MPTASEPPRPAQAAEKWLCLAPVELSARLREIRRRTLELVEDLHLAFGIPDYDEPLDGASVARRGSVRAR